MNNIKSLGILLNNITTQQRKTAYIYQAIVSFSQTLQQTLTHQLKNFKMKLLTKSSTTKHLRVQSKIQPIFLKIAHMLDFSHQWLVTRRYSRHSLHTRCIYYTICVTRTRNTSQVYNKYNVFLKTHNVPVSRTHFQNI